MTIKRMDKLPSKRWPKAPGKSYWAQDGDDYLLVLGTTTIGKVLPPLENETKWKVWAVTSLGDHPNDCTGYFKTCMDALEALVEHVEEYRTATPDVAPPPPAPAPAPEPNRLPELLRVIRVRTMAMGWLSLVGSGAVIGGYFLESNTLLGAGASAALAVAIMCFEWRFGTPGEG